mgnify:CR=1 FL=1
MNPLQMNAKAEIEAFAKEKMTQWGLTQKGWTFGWHNKRASFGTCSCRKKLIRLSTFLFDGIGQDEQRDTVLHEIAHALDFETRGKSDHGPIWKMWAVRVGAKPVRCKNVEQNHQEIAAKAKYTLRCPNGHEFARHRILRKAASCPKCYPAAFNKDYLLTTIMNY